MSNSKDDIAIRAVAAALASWHNYTQQAIHDAGPGEEQLRKEEYEPAALLDCDPSLTEMEIHLLQSNKMVLLLKERESTNERAYVIEVKQADATTRKHLGQEHLWWKSGVFPV